jgi:tRNA A-37 threonylcarbamoyl transferase component Bud32
MTAVQELFAGRYRLGESLGHGGMGRVWHAHDEVLDREVAIKEVILPFGLDEFDREDLLVRTLREARAAARLNHPNVVGIHDVARVDDRPWIVMEYVRSLSLMETIKKEGPLPVGRVAEIGLALLSALAASHRAGVLHRDVKPSNVLIAADGRVVLTDFGLAAFETGDQSVTRPGIIVGSPNYIAPERARDGVSTPASDLWSLGATLYSAVEGRAPHGRSTAMATLTALAIEEPDPTQRAGALQPVLEGLLRKDPRTRMAAAEAERLLRRVAAGQDTVPHPHARVPVSAPAPARGRWRWAVATVVVGVLAAVAGVLYTHGGASSSPAATVRSLAPSDPSAAGPVAAAGQAPQTSAPLTEAPLPVGLVWYQDPIGYRLAVPAGWPAAPAWQQRKYFCEANGGRMLEVGPWIPSNNDLVASLMREEQQARLAGYQRLRIEPLSGYRTEAAAEWEYLYTDPQRGRLHGITRGFIVADRAYLIEWRTPVAVWPANRGTLGTILDSFRAPRPTRSPL